MGYSAEIESLFSGCISRGEVVLRAHWGFEFRCDVVDLAAGSALLSLDRDGCMRPWPSICL